MNANSMFIIWRNKFQKVVVGPLFFTAVDDNGARIFCTVCKNAQTVGEFLNCVQKFWNKRENL